MVTFPTIMVHPVRSFTLQFVLTACAMLATACGAVAAENVKLLNVPGYTWYAGCFGTASGNLMGFWDRNGFPNMYTGPTTGGVAPLNSLGSNASVRSLWASQEGVDGRPFGKPGHIEDYWHSQDGLGSFGGTEPDPYVVLGREEHEPDCLGDFLGQSQRKYSNQNGECNGNIDGYAFNYWDKTGLRRTNFVPPTSGGAPARDIQSGLRAWSEYRGYEAEVTSQLANVNPETPLGTGFTFEDLRAEIDAGYPVMLILQTYFEFSRDDLSGMPRANPPCHAILAFGYAVTDGGESAIQFMGSWDDASTFRLWNSDIMFAELPLRGAITYRPQPKIKAVERTGNTVRMRWEGPNASMYDQVSETTRRVHNYVVERATVLDHGAFNPLTASLDGLEATFTEPEGTQAFYRVRLASGQ